MGENDWSNNQINIQYTPPKSLKFPAKTTITLNMVIFFD